MVAGGNRARCSSARPWRFRSTGTRSGRLVMRNQITLPRRRGKVIWFLMTSRPDLVPVDLKRQGRAEEHLALFPPATIAERGQVVDLLRGRSGERRVGKEGRSRWSPDH